MKWYTELEIVEEDTGELITKSEYERRNLVIRYKEHDTKIEEYREYNITKQRGIRKIRWICGENPQGRLF